METGTEKKWVLAINGSDGSGVTGVQADIRTIQALGGMALTAITTITMQNTLGIQEFYDLPADVFAKQVEAVMDDVQPKVLKIGLLRTRGQLYELCRLLRKYQPTWVVYDPVELTTKGERLVEEALKGDIANELLPLCQVVTNEIEVQSLINWDLHGMRGVFAAALATLLAQGLERENAVSEAVAYANRQAAKSEHLEANGANRYNELLALIAKNCQTHNDVHFYAEQMNVSTRYLAQITRRMAQVSPKALIDQLLVEKLRQALDNTSLTVQEIAYRHGFHSQSHFAKYFKKMTGMTPTEYKRK